jgi:O-methyltransferase involved in polyketide biosynthesis
VPVELNTSVPHSARIYDHLLGGKDNFPADRAAAAAIVEASPSVPISMRANRRYMARVARHLAAELGIRQFLDIGTGLPTSPNLHEVVQQVAPESRVVYVDNDPIVLVHARALLTSSPEGRTAYLDADLRDVPAILASPEVTGTLDLSRPTAVSLIAILQFYTDEEATRVIDDLIAALAPGSALAISTVTAHNVQAAAGAEAYKAQGIPMHLRTDAEVTALFRGLPLVEPGVTLVHRWHPDAEDEPVDDAHVMMAGGVAVKQPT